MRTFVSRRQVPYLRHHYPLVHCCLASVVFSSFRQPGVHSFLVHRSYLLAPKPAISLFHPVSSRSFASNMAPALKKKTNDDEADASAGVSNKRKRASSKVAMEEVKEQVVPTKASPRKTTKKAETEIHEAKLPKKTKKLVDDKAAIGEDGAVVVPSPRKPRKATAKQAAATDGEEIIPETPKKVKKVAHQVLTERDELPKLWDATKAEANGSYTFKIGSWNVAGLRALLRNHPDALVNLVTQHDLDVLCLQETKLQEVHLDDPKLKLRGHLLENEGYDAYYSCSTEKKGYSGTAVFIKRRVNGAMKQKTLDTFFGGGAKASKPKKEQATGIANIITPVSVSFEMGNVKHDTEGRLIVVDFPTFSLCNVYVPNSGQELKRLQYRLEEWDMDFLAFMEQRHKERGVPVMWLGDLNVAHTHLEVWNDGAKHLDKQAGVTPEERASFQKTLDSGWVDAFRRLHPTARGHYSYWSQRAGNRAPNKGLRLDYFICHPSFFDETSKVVARDSYMVADHAGSDHCPVILELEIRE